MNQVFLMTVYRGDSIHTVDWGSVDKDAIALPKEVTW
jgi:hypothetical protein